MELSVQQFVRAHRAQRHDVTPDEDGRGAFCHTCLSGINSVTEHWWRNRPTTAVEVPMQKFNGTWWPEDVLNAFLTRWQRVVRRWEGKHR